MDIALLFEAASIRCDIAIDVPGLLEGQDLATAVTMSVFTDRRANDDDPIGLNEDKRGWWADTYNEIRNDKIGSRLWLLRRSKQTNQTLLKAKEYILESLNWLIEDNVAYQIDVVTSVIDIGIMGIDITLQRPNGSQNFKFSYVWDQL